MTYRAGSYGCAAIGIPNADPHVICDSCHLVHYAKPTRHGMPAWLRNNKPPSGWAKGANVDGTRWDKCPECLEVKP